MNRAITTSFVVTFLLCAPARAQPADLARAAAALPKLVPAAGKLGLPLDNKAPFVWRAVRKGVVAASAAGRLKVSYVLAANQPAGAALMIAPGTLDGATTLRLRWHANRDLLMVVSLQDGAGVAYASAPIAVGTKADGAAEVDLAALGYLAAQSRARDPGSYRVADTILVTLIDISGYMSSEPHSMDLAVDSIEVAFAGAK